MFLAEVVTVLTKGLRDTFDGNYPEADFRNLHVSHEYPLEPQNYPGVWVDFRPQGNLRNAGIGYEEFAPDEADNIRRYRRWRFTGYAEFTIAALTSLERARLFDEMVKVLAFGSPDDPERSTFRSMLEDNSLISMSADFDEVEQSGFAATPGTPWGSDDIIYEATLRLEVVGEFVSDPSVATMVPLAEVRPIPYTEDEGDPTTGGGWV